MLISSNSSLPKKNVVYFPLLLVIILLQFGTNVAHAAPNSQTPLSHNIKPVPEGEALITLYINGVRYGDIECRIDIDNPFLSVPALKESLKDYLSPEQFELVFSVILSKLEWAGFDDLAAAQLTGSFNLSDLSYHLEVPASFAAEQTIDFSPTMRVADVQYFKPSFISGAINLTGTALLSVDPTTMTIPAGVTADIL